MNRFHVGRGATRGSLTVFPIWGETAHLVCYELDSSSARISERASGPEVGSLTVTNAAEVPLLLLEGQLLEGGMQHRMVARSILVPARSEVPIDVVCVEQGRWRGVRDHTARGRRASNRVRAGLRSANAQGEVWRRVSQYDVALGASETDSYVEKADRAFDRLETLVRGLHPFPGQVGVLVGIAGQPVMAEVFDSPQALAAQFDAVVRASALDAVGLPPEPTPAHRGHRFLDRAALVHPYAVDRAGDAVAVYGRSPYVVRSGLVWNDHDLHTVLANPRHELFLAPARHTARHPYPPRSESS